MTGLHHDPDSLNLDLELTRRRFDLELTRLRLAAMAMAIAGTEDCVADTLERLALTHPSDASELLTRAAQARRNAMLERNRAARFSRHL